MEIWLCEWWLLLRLWKLNSDHFVFTEYILLGLQSKPLAKIVVFMFFTCTGAIFWCRFRLGSRRRELPFSGERSPGTKGQHPKRSQHCSNLWFWQWTTRVLIAALGTSASPLPCWLCMVFLAVDGINRQKKKKDYNGVFVQVHNCYIFIDVPLDSHMEGKVEGWVVMEWLTWWLAGGKRENTYKNGCSWVLLTAIKFLGDIPN